MHTNVPGYFLVSHRYLHDRRFVWQSGRQHGHGQRWPPWYSSSLCYPRPHWNRFHGTWNFSLPLPFGEVGCVSTRKVSYNHSPVQVYHRYRFWSCPVCGSNISRRNSSFEYQCKCWLVCFHFLLLSLDDPLSRPFATFRRSGNHVHSVLRTKFGHPLFVAIRFFDFVCSLWTSNIDQPRNCRITRFSKPPQAIRRTQKYHQTTLGKRRFFRLS